MKLKIISLFILAASPLYAEPIGLVLSGGGAKGAYEVGVWKAMFDVGMATNVSVISGSSIGALNAALFASVRDPVQIERLWIDSFSEIANQMTDDVLCGCLEAAVDAVSLRARFIEERKRSFASAHGISPEDLSPKEIKKIEREAFLRVAAVMAKRGVSGCEQRQKYFDNFRKELCEALPKSWPSEAPLAYVTAVSKREMRVRRFLLNKETPERRVSEVAASCAIPMLFDPITIDGEEYQDGAIGKAGDKIPVQPLIANHDEIRTIVVVYLDDKKRLGQHRIRKEDYPKYNIVEIIPSQDIGLLGAVKFNGEAFKRLVDLGYRDGLRAFDVN